MERLLVRVTQIEELQGALEELVDLLFTGFVEGEESLKVEVRKSAVRDARREKLAQAAGIDGAKLSNLFEDDAAERILEDVWIEQTADFAPRSSLDQDRT
ncbi:MAG TPA: hypothetical protein VNB49_03760 [Candidatus Dormibacteraeota bacterium]|nr:hypothetical protein [Candidatus Dormibacteraeota bacterium]